MIKKKIKPTEIQNVAWDELQKGGPRGAGGKLSTKTMKVKDVEAPKKKKKKVTDNPEYKSVMDRMYA